MELREVYWVLHHGIRHTGMPAFGGSHSKEDLWAIATFVERFDEMTPRGTSSGSRNRAPNPARTRTEIRRTSVRQIRTPALQVECPVTRALARGCNGIADDA